MQTLEYRIHPSAAPFHNSLAQVKAICGPVGSGKTSACCWEIYYSLKESSIPLRWLVVRESYKQLHDSTRRTWEHWFGHISRYLKADERMLVTVENIDGHVLTHELDFRHARRPEEASNLLSTEYGGAWLEEVAPAYQMDTGVVGAGLSKELFDIILMRLRQPGAHRPHVLLSFNPPHRYHWTYSEFFSPKPRLEREQGKTPSQILELRDYALFRQPAFENQRYLRAGYYDDLLGRLDPLLAQRFVMGEPVTLYPGVRVFPEARESIHFREYLEVLAGVELVIGFDFGLTPVAVIGQVLPSGRLQIYREVQMFNAGIERLSEELLATLKERDVVSGGPRFKSNKWRCWGDPAGAQRAQTDEKTCYEILAHKGFNVAPGAVDWESRRQVVKQRLERTIDGEPAVLIDSTGCALLHEGMLGGYRYPKASSTGQVMIKPAKDKFSHVNDAFQYLCTGEYTVSTGEARHESAAPKRAQAWNPLADDRDRTTGGGWMAQ